MDEERRIVLDMATEGRLTPQEAEQLLEALEAEPGDLSPAPPALPAGQTQLPSYEQQPDWMTNLTTEQIIELKIHGVNPAFVQQARQLGLTNLSFEQLIQLAVHGIDTTFIQQFRDAGLEDLTFDRLIEFSVHGVDAAFVKQSYAAGFKDLGVEQVIQLAIHGVDAAFMHELGFGKGSSAQLSDLKGRAEEV